MVQFCFVREHSVSCCVGLPDTLALCSLGVLCAGVMPSPARAEIDVRCGLLVWISRNGQHSAVLDKQSASCRSESL